MQTIETDIAIVGGGIAGQVAALEAVVQGLNATLIEKMSSIGGSSVMSGGSMAFARTPEQRAARIEDSAELLREDMLTNGEGANDPALVDLYVSRQQEAYEFLRGVGAAFGPVQLAAGQSVPRTHPTDAHKLVETLNAKAIELGLRQLLGTRAQQLKTTGPNLPLRLVHASRNGDTVEIRSHSGIILTTGGFARGRDLLALFNPAVKDAVPGGGLGNEGDGLRMAWAHGADLANVAHVKPTFGNYIRPEPGRPHTIVHAIYRGAVAVNLAAERFADESRSYKVLGRACLQQPEGRAFQIFDSQVMAASVPGVRAFDFQAALARGHVVEAPTLAALAHKLGLPTDILERTIDTYNAGIRDGIDPDFGRRHLAHGSGDLTPIASAPFYGYPCTAGINSTYGGLKVDPAMRVLNVYGQPIPGLFAAGELVGGFHGAGYMSGSALVKSVITGREAVQSALNVLPEGSSDADA